MLRIISSKLAQRTPGDLSIPHTNQQVLQPYKSLTQFVSRELQKRKREKARNKPYRYLARYERLRDPRFGTCPSCGQAKSINERGKIFCPTPECNMARPRFT